MVAGTKTKKKASKKTNGKANGKTSKDEAPGASRKTVDGGPRKFKIVPARKSFLALTIVGDTPILVHRMCERALAAIADKQNATDAVKKKREPRLPAREYSEAKYLINDSAPHLIHDEWSEEFRQEILDLGGAYKSRGEDVPGFPVIGVYKAMKRACKHIAGLSMADAPAMFRIRNDGGPVAELSELKYSVNMMRRDRVVLQGKTATVAYRPQYNDWSLRVCIEFNPDMIAAEKIVNVLSDAGSVGIGAWRPEKDGIFGQFHLDSESVMLTEEKRD